MSTSDVEFHSSLKRSVRRRCRQSLPSVPLFSVANPFLSPKFSADSPSPPDQHVLPASHSDSTPVSMGGDGSPSSPGSSSALERGIRIHAPSWVVTTPPRMMMPMIPPIGVGTYELRGEDCVRAVRTALRIGFRLLDTAAAYRNEALVGEGIRQSGIPREELFVNVKIAMKSMGSVEKLRAGILQSIDLLGIGYADAVLVHWPGCGGLKPEDAAGHSAARRRCWEVMHALQLEGKVRAIGVSNFLPRHFAELKDMPWAGGLWGAMEAGVVAPHQQQQQHPQFMTTTTMMQNNENFSHHLPVLNQIELHPLCLQQATVEYCRSHGMRLQQYSPLGKGDARLLQHPTLIAIHQTHFAPSGYSIPDMLLLWGLLHGFIPLVRSGNESHLRANFALAADYYGVMDTQESEEEEDDDDDGNKAEGHQDGVDTGNNNKNHHHGNGLDETEICCGSCSSHDGQDANDREIKAASKGEEEKKAQGAMPLQGRRPRPSQRPRQRPPLTDGQREVLLHLRQHLGITEDEHLCWNSVTIA